MVVQIIEREGSKAPPRIISMERLAQSIVSIQHLEILKR